MKAMKTSIGLALSLLFLLSCMLFPASAAEHPFTDVPEGSWYSRYVQYVYDNGLMNGTSATTFSPETTMDRAMLVTVLYRMDGSKKAVGETPFTDVATNGYYYDALVWAYQSKIINGTSNTQFSPHIPISREMMVTIFYRYAQYIGRDVSKLDSLNVYTDTDSISNYAKTPFMWSVANGIISGTSSTELSPVGTATRAQCAAVLQRFMEWTKIQNQPETEPGTEPDPEVHTHTYTSEVKVEATCTEVGEVVYTCSICDDVYSEVIPAKGHNYNETVTKPTCTSGGYTTYKCKVCGHSYKGKETPATGHDYNETVTKPTCTERGYTTYKCKNCNHTYTGNQTNATGHKWGSWVTTKEPTETTTGTAERKCANCGKVETKTLDKLPPSTHTHSYTSKVTKNATCTTDGVRTYTCSCGDSYTEVIKAYGHDYQVVEEVDATCTKEGYWKYECSKCHDSYKETFYAEHEWQYEYTEATGHYEYWYVCHCGGWEFNAANGNPGPSFGDHVVSVGSGSHSYYDEKRWIEDTPATEQWKCKTCGKISATKPQSVDCLPVVSVYSFDNKGKKYAK